MRLYWFAGLLAALALTGPGWAASPQTRISGTITQFDGADLDVLVGSGKVIRVMLSPTVMITALEPRALADIKPGDFVGSAAIKGGDGRLHALEVHIFPPNLRGMGEGHRLLPGGERSMTNAVVDGIASAANGRELRLTYPGGEQTIDVAQDTRVVAIVMADGSILLPGSAVLVLAAAQPDGILWASMVQGEKDGVKPLN